MRNFAQMFYHVTTNYNYAYGFRHMRTEISNTDRSIRIFYEVTSLEYTHTHALVVTDEVHITILNGLLQVYIE